MRLAFGGRGRSYDGAGSTGPKITAESRARSPTSEGPGKRATQRPLTLKAPSPIPQEHEEMASTGLGLPPLAGQQVHRRCCPTSLRLPKRVVGPLTTRVFMPTAPKV